MKSVRWEDELAEGGVAEDNGYLIARIQRNERIQKDEDLVQEGGEGDTVRWLMACT
jgi:hypothetical protein